MMKPLAHSILVLAGACALAQQAPQNPFQPPIASMHYAPDRTVDLRNLDVTVDVDYPNRTITGRTVNTVAPLRDGVTEVRLMAGPDIALTKVTVAGREAKYRREGMDLFIQVGETQKGRPFDIAIDYSAKNTKASSFGAGGWHWVEPRGGNPDRVGFWTQGETEFTALWAPTWNYPNDLTTSETHCTVPADWSVIGNGILKGTKLSPDKKRKTFDWKMTQPHATYLLTLCGGPFDIKKDNWQGVDLWYVVPKGNAKYIDSTMGHTKDMLSFFSSRLGVKYPWPKYAQDYLYDFGGGMENVSATSLGEGDITEPRDGWFQADSVNSHELGHQWFGDYVTCKDWGDIYLNESFATFMEMIYMEHSRGANALDWEVEDNTQAYLQEAKSYKRPLSTKMYRDPIAMFDSHTYPKGGVILHTLRRYLGDENFYAGLKNYLTMWAHTPVESAQLRRAFIEATGINVEPFWAQWIDKPGHPVLDYTWSYAEGKIALEVKQLQDTSDGTPIYDLPCKVDVISGAGEHHLFTIHLSKPEESFSLDSPMKPGAVVLDPRNDFLREIPNLHWSPQEQKLILQFALDAVDRFHAMEMLLKDPMDANVDLVVRALSSDMSDQPALRSARTLANLAKPELRDFWTAQLKHPNYDRRFDAALALSKLPPTAETTAVMRSLINNEEAIRVVVMAVDALAKWDPKGNVEVFKKAAEIEDRRGRIKRAAESALKKAAG